MKLYNFLAIAVTVTAMTACSNNATDGKSADGGIDFSAKTMAAHDREPGQIPQNINFIESINEAAGNPAAYMAVLRNYKIRYGQTDFYNNLFEVTAYELFKEEKFQDLPVSDIKFLVQEMRQLQSNMVNMENIPSLMRAAYRSGVVTPEEFNTISDELLAKNLKEINSIPEQNPILQKEKLQEIENIRSELNYRRANY